MKSKWIYIINERKDGTSYKDILTNKRSCPVCGEYRRIERLVTFIVQRGVGIMKPYRCKNCKADILVATGDLLDHVNERGRDYPIDPEVHSAIPLLKDLKDETN